MLTPEQIKEYRNRYDVAPFDEISVPSTADKEGFLKNFIQKQTEIFEKRSAESGEIQKGYKEGKISLPETALQLTGGAVGGVFEHASELPIIKQGLDILGFGIQKLSETAPIRKAGEKLEPATAKMVNWYDSLSPEDQRSVRAIGNILAILPTGKMVSSAEKFIGKEVTPRLGKIASETLPFAETGTKLFNSIVDYAKGRVPKLLGIFTGENDDVIRAAMRNPQAADIGIQGGDKALREVAKEGSENSVKMRDSFIQAHNEAMRQMVFEDMKVTSGWSKGMKQGVISQFESYLKANGVKYSSGKLDFSTSKIKANPGEISKINSAYEAILNWKNWSQYGVYRLKQLIGELTRFPTETGGRAKSPMLSRMYGYLDEQVKAGLPSDRIAIYEDLNNKFSSNINYFEDLVDAFNSGDPFTRIANSIGKNKDSIRVLLEWYEKQSGKAVLPVVAGRDLAMEKTAAFGFLNPRSWIDFFISPENQAKIVTKVGKIIPTE
jgi:hypothetical protein